MSANYQKLWLGSNLNRLAMRKANDQIALTGFALPCKVTKVSGSIVTVSFAVNSDFTLPKVTIPKAESQWVRAPTQIGDLGYTVPADAYLGGVSGLGGGVASLLRRHNLTALAFVPLGNTGFSPAPDPNKVWINGPNGAVISDSNKNSVITVTPSSITLAVGGQSIVITASSITIGGIVWATHVHSGVTTGSGDTGPPV